MCTMESQEKHIPRHFKLPTIYWLRAIVGKPHVSNRANVLTYRIMKYYRSYFGPARCRFIFLYEHETISSLLSKQRSTGWHEMLREEKQKTKWLRMINEWFTNSYPSKCMYINNEGQECMYNGEGSYYTMHCVMGIMMFVMRFHSETSHV